MNDQKYSIPDGLRVYAIGDVHGCVDHLHKMHEAISADLLRGAPAAVHIVYLGDYIDRGPDSKGVIETLIERRDRGDGIAKTFLKGNHENGFKWFMDDPVGENFLKWGGVEMLASYGVVFDNPEAILPAEKKRAADEMRRAMPAAHFEFLAGLELYTQIGDYVFVHAGINPFVGMDAQSEQDLTFMREPFLAFDQHELYAPLPFKVVHGHSVMGRAPVDLPHRIGVDTGAYQGGPLSAVVLEGADVRFLGVG